MYPLISHNFSEIATTQVHVHMKRHAMSDLPETDDEVAQWCKDIFMAKVLEIEFLLSFSSQICEVNQ